MKRNGGASVCCFGVCKGFTGASTMGFRYGVYGWENWLIMWASQSSTDFWMCVCLDFPPCRAGSLTAKLQAQPTLYCRPLREENPNSPEITYCRNCKANFWWSWHVLFVARPWLYILSFLGTIECSLILIRSQGGPFGRWLLQRQSKTMQSLPIIIPTRNGDPKGTGSVKSIILTVPCFEGEKISLKCVRKFTQNHLQDSACCCAFTEVKLTESGRGWVGLEDWTSLVAWFTGIPQISF